MTSSSRKKLIVAAVAVLAVAVGAWLAFGIFGIHTLFTDTEVNEAGPTFASGAEDAGSDDDNEATNEIMSAPADAADNPTGDDDAGAGDGAGGGEGAETGEAGDVVTLASGQFTGDTGHEVTGQALVLNDGSEQRFLRLEGFESTNGPDLNVYLRADDGEFVDLGDLKGNIGDQNYEIPVDVDLERFNTVQIWCVRFAVLFGDAALA